MPTKSLPFESIGRLPAPTDNVAIATRILPTGTRVAWDDTHFTLDFTVLLGHRFAVRPIDEGEGLLSWGLPFGLATRPILPGHYVANEGMIEALRSRTFDPDLGYHFPQTANFRDRVVPYEVDEATFCPGPPVTRYPTERTFMGYRRAATRGVGTRNMIVILGTTSSTASYARALAQRLQPAVSQVANIDGANVDGANIDGIVPIAHTEGGGYVQINNRDFLLRTLAGLMVHPNVAAVLAVDLATDPINNTVLQNFMAEQGYPLHDVTHHFYSLSGDFEVDLAHGAALVEPWLSGATSWQRTPESISHLSIALQCGGSDAFSGISGNPLAASVAKEVIRYGGRANLAETDELIGSEAYVLNNVASLTLARKFLNFVAVFKERLAWHGQSAEGNPSGGNKYRGLYNIALKSIGAAAKRDPDVRLEHVVDYGERMLDPGYYFMNTPGNDLESIGGQVAGGSNLIIFITGNGSITNFPFVPTLKVMTTTQRYQLLENEMDVNAGAYLDGRSMDELTAETLELLIAVASGQPSKGELAGHSQISIWRNWQQQDRSRLPLILERVRPDGEPIALNHQPQSSTSSGDGEDELRQAQPSIAVSTARFDATPTHGKIGLILPTSLCSGQIARLAADRLNQLHKGGRHSLTRFTTLVHTEGCGVAFASTREVYAETMVGYAIHPLVGACLFLEHGCEKAHNDYLHSLLVDRGLVNADFGWASVQLDGGIEKVIQKITQYFQPENIVPPSQPSLGLSIALMVEDVVPDEAAGSLAQVIQQIVAIGGSVVVPGQSPLAQAPAFLQSLGLAVEPKPSLAYGQSITQPGFHLMEVPTPHWSETITGLGATGAEVILAFTDKPRAGHPLIPVLQVSHEGSRATADFVLNGEPAVWSAQILAAIAATVSGELIPRSLVTNNIDFQLTRGWLGIST